MFVEDLLNQYGAWLGYCILLLGSFVEGESVVLTAGFFAYKGYLSLLLIILISFMGSLCADQLLFFVGRWYGPNLLVKKPKLKEKAAHIFKLLHKYNIIFILGFRFIYGIRTVSPLVIGASDIPTKRFVILNFIAAAIWAVISCCGGYLLGYFFADDIDYVITQAIKYQKITIATVITIIIALIMVKRYYKRNHESQLDHSNTSNHFFE